LKNNSLTRTDLHKLNNKLVSAWLKHFGAQINHWQTWTHKTHHSLDLRKATTFPLIIYSTPGHGTNTQMSFCPEIPHNWDSYGFGAHNFACRPPIEMKEKIVNLNNLTPDPSYGHNLCFKCPNGSCEPILNITFYKFSNNIRKSSIQWVLTPTIAF
jgi:hypothetical protein